MCLSWTLEGARMSAKAVDVLILIPLIPALPVVATWFLPWEDWIPRKVPKRILAPYLLYCTFAAWHFGFPWWSLASVAFLAVGASVMLVSELRKMHRLKAARNWPTAAAQVL